MLSSTKKKINSKEAKLCVIGLGYVGLPLAVEFAKNKRCFLTGKLLSREVIGFDTNQERIEDNSRFNI